MISIRNDWKQTHAVLLAATCIFIGLTAGCMHSKDKQSAEEPDVGEQWAGQAADICGKTAWQLAKACKSVAQDDTEVEVANCLNLSNPQASTVCLRAAEEARIEALDACDEVQKARVLACGKLGMGAYDPVINPANFVTGITSRYTPFPVGAYRVYESNTPEGLERITITALPDTRVIMGVTVTTLHDLVTLRAPGSTTDVVIEDTLDWIAQDKDGNVWYFGEISQKYENGKLASLDGSFEAGIDGAKPGYWSKGNPQIGDFFRQEWSLGNAEDVVEVLSLDARDAIVPFSGTSKVLKTEDTTPMSPGVIEYKYYVPGIGFTLEIKPATGERLELVEYGPR